MEQDLQGKKEISREQVELIWLKNIPHQSREDGQESTKKWNIVTQSREKRASPSADVYRIWWEKSNSIVAIILHQKHKEVLSPVAKECSRVL